MSNEKKKYAQVIYDYNASYADELTVKCSEVLEILYKIDDDWVYARSLMLESNAFTNAFTGMVPINYLNFIDIPDYLLFDDTSVNKYELFLGIQDFEFKENNDLDFKKGQLIVSQKVIDSDWYQGFYLNDFTRAGIFPTSSVIKVYLKSSSSPIDQANLKENKSNLKKYSPDKIENNISSKNEYQFTNDESQEFDNPKQAQVLYTFGRESDNDQIKYLKLEAGDYILVTGNFDENWVVCENFKNEKGLFPTNYIKYIEEQKSESEPMYILNRTQRRYTVINTEEMKIQPETNTNENVSIQNKYDNNKRFSLVNNIYLNERENSKEILNNNSEPEKKPDKLSAQELNAYGCIDYDFNPEHECELGCLRGEYLKIISDINSNSGWVKCENFYRKTGLVPSNFITILDETNGKILFENQNKISSKRLSDPIQNFKNEIFYFKSNSLTNTTKESLKIEKKSEDEKIIFRSNLKHQASFPINTESSNTFRVANSIKPQLPPKPKLRRSANKNTQNVVDDVFNASVQNKPRPITFNKDIQENIKRLESIIGQQPLNLKPRPDSFNSNLEKVNQAYEDETNTSKNLTNLKNLFGESVKNRISPEHNITENNSKTENKDKIEHLVNNEDTEIELKKQTDKSLKKKNERIQVLNELITTEKEFYYELKLCYDTFMTENSENNMSPVEFNKNILFEKLKPILDFSKSLIMELDMELEKCDQNLQLIKVGELILTFIDQMRLTYAQYTRNHNEVADQLKKYQLNPAINSYITSQLNLIKDKVRVAELATLLIKPVQRIFKYPLFVNRLIQNTEQDHEDFQNLQTLAKSLTDMLEFINEYKRRKDLVSKYLTNDQAEISWSEWMKKINIRTLKKKSGRFTHKFSTALGFYNPLIVDRNFESEEATFRISEKVVKNFQEDVNSFLNNLGSFLDAEKDLFYDILYIAEEDYLDFSKFERSSNSNYVVQFQDYSTKITQTILSPLNSLVKMFNGPNKLIEKRIDKLMDYESALALQAEYKITGIILVGHSNKEIETHVELTKKVYEAMNSQLIEDLSKLNQQSLNIVSLCFRSFTLLTSQFLNFIDTNYKHNIKATKLNISVEKFNSSLNQRINSLNAAFNRQSLLQSTQTLNETPLPKDIYPIQTEDQRNRLLKKYSPDKLYIVTQKYIANPKLCQLNQNINDLVGLMIDHDPANQKHIWFVDNGKTEGFMPCSALTAYKEMYHDNNLIEFENDASPNKKDIINSDPSVNRASFLNESLLQKGYEEFCIALYNFKSIATNMIDLKEGEIYHVLEKCDKKNDPEWWLVECEKTKSRGYVPKNYVKLLD